MDKPDRYTMISKHIDDLPATLKHIKELEMVFVVLPDWGSRERVDVCIFFDSKGMSNYLAGNYGEGVDSIRGLAASIKDDAELGRAIRGYLGEIYGI